MRVDVLILLTGLACIFAGLWLIVGIPGDVNRELRELLAVLFFITGVYLGFDFVTDWRADRRGSRDDDEAEADFEKFLQDSFRRRR